MAIVEVRPLPIPRWHGKTGKESFGQPVSLEVLFDGATGAYATGLTEEETVEYSKLLSANLSPNVPMGQPHPYFSTQAAVIKLENRTTTFNTANPADFVKCKNMKASRYVANSLREWQEGLWEEATHYIYDETEEVEVKASKFQKKMEVSTLVSAMTDAEKASLIQIVGETTVTGRSKNFIDGKLGELIEDSTKLDALIQWAKADKQELYTRGAVLEAIHRRILTKQGSAVHFMGDRIASDTEDAIKWFLDPENQKQKALILGKLTKA